MLSTHDLTRRSTRLSKVTTGLTSPFNSRPHTEVDRWCNRKSSSFKPFNSRPHTEVDGKISCIRWKHCPFNSRPHTEVDDRYLGIYVCMDTFQLTTSHGGRHEYDYRIGFIDDFQLTTSHGGRHSGIKIYTAVSTFQLTTSHGGRRQIPTIIANICIHYSLFYIKLSFLHYFIFNFRINFLLCGSHIRCESPAILCPLHIRTKELTSQSHQSWALFQYAPLCFYTYLPGYKIADCLLPCL